jgi:hypothetical protein
MKTLNYLTIIVTAVCAIYLTIVSTACSDTNESDDSKDSASIGQCEDFVEILDQCFDLTDWGIESVQSGKQECQDGDFDSYDQCLFKCNSDSFNCEVLETCVNNCG